MQNVIQTHRLFIRAVGLSMPSSPFACNRKNLFQGKAKESAPPEPVVLVADKSQIITAIIPFSTKQAATIRAHMHTNVLTSDNQKIFIYRSVNGWTNISLEATEASPKLTLDPITTLIIAWQQFTACTAVSTVTIKWKGSNTELGYDDIAAMEKDFDALPEPTGTEDNEAGGSKTDAEIMTDMIDVNTKSIAKLSQSFEHIEQRMEHLINVVERVAVPPQAVTERALTPPPNVAPDPVTSPARAGKRKAR